MKIAANTIELACAEPEIYNRLLDLDGKNILELGCGNAEMTRDLAASGRDRRVTALEVDEIAHEQNLQIRDLPNVVFGLAGAQAIPLDDESVDVVFMFKSLHHVPVGLMAQSMQEIRRVLKPGALAYISEPVFAGDFNEILRLFHDEREVREAAFSTLEQVVDAGQFELVDEVFFNAPVEFESFADYENKVIGVSHTRHELDESLYRQVRQRFDTFAGDDGCARFLMPIRVDLLRRPD